MTLPVLSNGHANGNGNGNGHAKAAASAINAAPGRQHQGRVLDQCRLTQLRRLRLDHGPQRQLLQVPQLRLHERLQLRLIGAVRCLS